MGNRPRQPARSDVLGLPFLLAFLLALGGSAYAVTTTNSDIIHDRSILFR